MSGTVELPVWLVTLAGVLAAIGLIDRLLTPAMRWFFRRRVNRAIEELNTRLQLKIKPFGLTKRRILTDRLSHDTEVMIAAEEYARQNDMPVSVAMERAERYAREIAPAFNAYAYFRIVVKLARWIANSLYRVRLGYSDGEALRGVKPDSSVVFIMNHRSNMDYFLLGYLAATSTALSYAVGEWARLPILQTVMRTMGAYFIRRNARDDYLYRRVLAVYVRMATEAGVTQAIFPEGRLSRDGRLHPARFGLVSYILMAHEHDGRDTVFIPVGVNYDRVLEDRSLVAAAMHKETPKTTWQKTTTTLAFLFKNLRLRLAGRWHRFGYACVSFGSPVSVREFMAENNISHWAGLEKSERMGKTQIFGEKLMDEIGRLIPVLPVSLVSLILIDAGEAGIDRLELKSRANALIDHLIEKGAHLHIPHDDRDYEVTVGLRMLTMRHIVTKGERGVLKITPGDEPLVEYYANSIRHLI